MHTEGKPDKDSTGGRRKRKAEGQHWERDVPRGWDVTGHQRLAPVQVLRGVGLGEPQVIAEGGKAGGEAVVMRRAKPASLETGDVFNPNHVLNLLAEILPATILVYRDQSRKYDTLTGLIL